jgi:hypothetical protein
MTRCLELAQDLVAPAYQLRTPRPTAAVIEVRRDHLQALKVAKVQGDEDSGGIERGMIGSYGCAVAVLSHVQGSRGVCLDWPVRLQRDTLYVIEELERSWARANSKAAQVHEQGREAHDRRVVRVPHECSNLVERFERQNFLLDVFIGGFSPIPHLCLLFGIFEEVVAELEEGANSRLVDRRLGPFTTQKFPWRTFLGQLCGLAAGAHPKQRLQQQFAYHPEPRLRCC